MRYQNMTEQDAKAQVKLLRMADFGGYRKFNYRVRPDLNHPGKFKIEFVQIIDKLKV